MLDYEVNVVEKKDKFRMIMLDIDDNERMELLAVVSEAELSLAESS